MFDDIKYHLELEDEWLEVAKVYMTNSTSCKALGKKSNKDAKFFKKG